MWGVQVVQQVTRSIKTASFDILVSAHADSFLLRMPSSLMGVTGERSAHRLEVPGS